LGELRAETVVTALEEAVGLGFAFLEEFGKEAVVYPVERVGCLMKEKCSVTRKVV
jgi:hypothetical protein